MITQAALLPTVGLLVAAQAQALSLDVPGEAERNIILYACSDGAQRSVEYLNAGENRLALVPIDGASRVFVNVISGSGARYVSGSLEWWSKGAEAVLTDAMADPDAQPATCRS